MDIKDDEIENEADTVLPLYEEDYTIDDDDGPPNQHPPLVKSSKPKKPRDPNIQDVRLPVEIDIANDAKKMGKMIRRGRVSLFLEYIREGLQKSIIEEQEILKAKGFVPTSNLLINVQATVTSQNAQSQITKVETEDQTD
ncbi:hypothetical protein JNK13_03935 [bacterium]|nr:hypothetical protein [bacterium]